MKTLIFTAEGTYARFRCSYTTTSALTYSLMHPIAIKGLLGAIMGIDYSELYEYTKDIKVGIQVLNPVYKDTQSFNLIPQKGQKSEKTSAPNFQSRIEFLRDVKYRIFINCNEGKLNHIAEILVSREYQFTPYLGCSEHIAKLEFEDIKEAILKKIKDKGTSNTVTPKELIVRNDDEDFNINIDRIPVENSVTREYVKYTSVGFSTDKPINIANCSIYKVGEDNVYFL